MPRTKDLDVNSISPPLQTLTALLLPVDGGEASFVEVELVMIVDEDGNSRLFPDGRLFWNSQGMRRASATIFDLDLGPLSGQYFVAGTDVLSGLPLNEHLMHRPPGFYGDVLVMGWTGWELVDVPKGMGEMHMLLSALDQIVVMGVDGL